MNHAELAKQNFESGCNCAQAVLLAFSDLTGLNRETALRLSSSFGGGMGRMREVCGALSGMFLAAGLLYGTLDSDSQAEKGEHYARIRALADAFAEKNGAIVCRTLLGVDRNGDPVPQARTAQYYAQRPCGQFCFDAAQILDDYIAAHPQP